jgi:hypothetical protein
MPAQNRALNLREKGHKGKTTGHPDKCFLRCAFGCTSGNLRGREEEREEGEGRKRLR